MVHVERAAISGGDGAALVKLKQALAGLVVKEEKLLKQELASLVVKEEKLWHQHSKTHWMKEGDKNS